ncbi:MAG: LacI family DNA-binding transcriptional regulator [Caldilineaceae bacterium]
MTTIKDVAKKAGVSVSTVSYALNGKRPISAATRQRILDAIQELNYHPNLLARGLINKRTRIIALLYPALFPDSLDELALEFIASITQVTYQHNYGLLLFTNRQGEQDIQQFINQGLVDGIVLMEVLRHDPRTELMKQYGYPFSLIGHSEFNDGISFVDVDFYSAYRQAIQHLVGLNHHHLAFLPSIVDVEHPKLNYMHESIRGFRETVAELGIQGTIHGCEPTPEEGYKAMTELLERQPQVRAVIAGSERIYNGVSKALQDKGLRVPEDFSIIGVISSRSAEKYTPSITTISLPAIEMGRMGTEFLINQLEDPNHTVQQVILPPQFVVRQSTGPRNNQ